MGIPARIAVHVRLAAGGAGGVLCAVGLFALLQSLVDVQVSVTGPAVESPIIAGPISICLCGVIDPSRVKLDFPVLHDFPHLHELLTPLASLVAQVTFTDDLVDLQIPLDIRLVDQHEAARRP